MMLETVGRRSLQAFEANIVVCTCRLEELTAPYYKFKEAGWKCKITSVKGGKVPLGESSVRPGP
jgi:hypothetical protein